MNKYCRGDERIYIITIGHCNSSTFTQLFFRDKDNAQKELECFYNNYMNTCMDRNATETPKYNDLDCKLEQFYTEDNRYYNLTDQEII